MRAASINIDDSVLVQQSQAGDTPSMERLILKYQHRIYNVTMKMCGNADDAAELTQETFVKVIESIEKFKGRSSFYTWLFRIAVNLTLNHCQRSARTATCSLDAEGTDPDGETSQLLRDVLSDDRVVDPAVLRRAMSCASWRSGRCWSWKSPSGPLSSSGISKEWTMPRLLTS